MADGGDEKEKMRKATARLFEKRTRDAEAIQTDTGRIAMPVLSNKWQTIIDDTIIPRIQHQESAVRKRSKSITPEDETRRPSRPLSMPTFQSPLPVELYDDIDFHEEQVVKVEEDSPRRSRPPARLDPLQAPPAPPSYDEALHMDEGHNLPRSMPFYGRLWQMSKHWEKQAFKSRHPEESNGATGITSGRPLPSIDVKDSDKETTFTDIDRAHGRRTSFIEAVNVDTTTTERRNEFDVEEGRREQRRRPECDNWFGRKFPRVVRYLQSLTPERMMVLSIAVIVIIGLILFIGLFPASFVYVEYHEMALLKNKVTGSVNRDDVYMTGCYVLGPDKEFIRYPATANIISETIDVFNVDRLEIRLSFHLQYYIRSSEVGELHREFELDYNEVIRNVIISEIKNNVGRFDMDFFRLSRKQLEKFILEILKTRLEGNCCKSCCPSSCTNNTLCVICDQSNTCRPGYHVDIKYFQLTELDIPTQVSNLYVQQLVLQVEAEKEFLKQDHAIVVKKTEKMTQVLKNEAQEILEEAKAEASKRLVLAEAGRESNLTSAYVHGLQFLYLTLSVNDLDHKLSLMMMRALEDVNVKGNLYRGYGYNMSTIASP